MLATMPDQPLRLAIVNDYEIVVVGIAGVLADFRDRIEVVELDSGLPVQHPADLVLYDSFGQPQGAAIDIEARVGESGGRLVVFSWNVQRDLVQQSLRAGAAGYVPKTVTGAELVDALERIHAGEVVTPATYGIADDGAEGGAFGRYPGAGEDLSPREAEVLALICQGLSNEQVADRAILGVNTVKTYIRSLYRKIGAESRTQAVLWGVDHGFRPDRARHRGDDGPVRGRGSREAP